LTVVIVRNRTGDSGDVTGQMVTGVQWWPVVTACGDSGTLVVGCVVSECKDGSIAKSFFFELRIL
jgi:hypothetical protein